MSTEFLSGELASFIRQVPYNSLEQFYSVLRGGRTRLRLGANCVWQAMALLRRVQRAGQHGWLLGDRRHALVMCEVDDTAVLLDPYLLPTNPIQLRLPLQPGDRMEVGALPARRDRSGTPLSSYIEAVVAQDRRVRLRYLRHSAQTGDYFTYRLFRVDARVRHSRLPPREEVIPLLFHPEQTTLSVRMVLADESLLEIVYPICWYFRRVHRPEHLLIRLNDGSFVDATTRAPWLELLHVAERHLRMRSGSLVEYFLEGARLYDTHAPNEVAFHDYDPARF